MRNLAVWSVLAVGVAVGSTLSLTACASMRSTPAGTTPIGQTAAMLNDRMGLMNYDEALQRFRIPTRCADGEATKVCSWVYPPGPLSPIEAAAAARNPELAPTIIVQHQQTAPSAILTFTNRVLSNWALNGNWR